MDYAAKIKDARAALRGRRDAGDVGREDYHAMAARIARLGGRAQILDHRRRRHALAAAWVNDALDFARQALLTGRVAAIDTGRSHLDMRLVEVGIATIRDGVVDVATHRDRGHVHGRQPLHGPVNVVDAADLRGIVSHRCRDADLVVFHDASGDLDALDLEADRVVHVDTSLVGALLADLAVPESLTAAYRRYVGGLSPHAHESGNDAARTLEVLVAMALGPRLPSRGLSVEGRLRHRKFGRNDGVLPARTWERVRRPEVHAPRRGETGAD